MNNYNLVEIISDEDWGLSLITPTKKYKPLIEEIKPVKKNVITFCDPEEVKNMQKPKPSIRLVDRNNKNTQNILVGFK